MSEWQPIETAPKGQKIIVCWFNELGKYRVCTARFYPAQTLDLSDEADPEDGDEDGFAPEGWYEESETHDNLLRLNVSLRGWMPLPEPPK